MRLIIIVLFLFSLTQSFAQEVRGKFSVGGVPNTLPVVFAGIDQAITLPTSTTTLTGSATDADGIVSYAWTQRSGPVTATFSTPLSATTDISDLEAGTYLFRLSATDRKGGVGFDYVIVVVNSITNVSPIANAGANQSITLPTNQVQLSGSGTDLDGTVDAYLWTLVSGPSGSTIVAPTMASTAVTGLVAGTYKFKLTVMDNLGGTGTNNVMVVVNATPPANILPIANAGVNQIIIQ